MEESLPLDDDVGEQLDIAHAHGLSSDSEEEQGGGGDPPGLVHDPSTELLQALRGPADPLLDPGPWSLDLGAWILGLSWDDLRVTWGFFGQSLVILEPSWGYLERS